MLIYKLIFIYFLLYSRSLLVIHLEYSSVYLSIPYYPFPLATIGSFSKSVSLCFVSKFICIISF